MQLEYQQCGSDAGPRTEKDREGAQSVSGFRSGRCLFCNGEQQLATVVISRCLRDQQTVLHQRALTSAAHESGGGMFSRAANHLLT